MSAQNRVNNNRKRKSTKSTKSKRKVEFEKGKVYIPAYKMIIFCACVIVVCVTLLLISTLKSKDSGVVSREKIKKETVRTEKIAELKKESAKKNEPAKKVEKSQEKKPATDSVSIKPNQPKADKPVANKVEKSAEKNSEKHEGKAVENKSAKKSDETGKTAEKNQVKKENQTEEKKSVTETNKASEKSREAEEKTTAPASKNPEPPKPQESIKIEKPVETKAEQKPIVTKSPDNKSYNFPQAKNNAQLVFLFDDGGQNLNHLKPFLELPFPITIAVLPRLTYSVESANRIRESGHELMLHQPMQAVNDKVNPGPGAIKPDMSESEIMSILFQNINEIGPIAGFNNHEGSAITADAEKMEVIMKMATENGIFFLDSRTNKDTKVPYVAKEMGYSYYERNGFFLDNEKTKENALKELRRNLDIANKNGSVIMIGHIWSADFLPEFLREVYPELKEKGYTFTTVSKSKGKKN